jgi:hypothetical protein
MGKRLYSTSSSTSTTRNPAVSADPLDAISASPRSPPLKRRAIRDNSVSNDSGPAVPPQLSHAVPRTRSASSSSSSSIWGSCNSTERGLHDGRDAVARVDRKRGRSVDVENGSGSSGSDATARGQSCARRRGEGGALLDTSGASPPSSLVTTGPTGPNTNRTLVYGTSDTPSAGASPSSPPAPPRRNVVLLSSTPDFLRRHHERRDTDDSGDGGEQADRDGCPPLATATPASPLRLVRAAQEFLSPARSTLLRGLSHLRQSVAGTTSTRQTVQRSPRQQRRQQRHKASTRTSPLPSPSPPWGRLSSIKPTQDDLPSLPMAPRSEASQSGGNDTHRSQCPASAPTLLGLSVPSISGSRRSSVSVSEGWRAGELHGLEPGRGGPHRPTIQRDSEDALGSSASVRTVSVGSSRLSSPSVREVAELGVRNTYHHHHRRQRHFHTDGDDELVNPPATKSKVAGGAGSAALAGPYDARYASVSSLSESLANIVSSSRSTAQSSLTSAGAAAGGGGSVEQRGDTNAGAATAAAAAAASPTLPRRSATIMDPDLSPILPDEEERAVRRRMQRHGHRQRLHGVLKAEQNNNHGNSTSKPIPPISANVLELRSVGPPTLQQDRRNSPPRRSGLSRMPVHIFPPVAISAPSQKGKDDSGGAAAVTEQLVFRPIATASSSRCRRIARVTRTLLALSAVVVFVWCVAATTWPLVALQAPYAGYRGESSWLLSPSHTAAEAVFLYTHVNPVTDLQALYQVAPASLDAAGVARLHRRVLGEGVERLERATQHVAPNDSTPPPLRLLYYRAMIRAYLVVQRNSELYARSRDGSRWRRLVRYPVADVVKYGLHRFGSFTPRGSSLARSQAREWCDRIVTTIACSAQSELVSCPSVLYVEEAMARAAAPFVYTDVNEAHKSTQRRQRLQDLRTRLHRDWASEVYLETLLNFLRSSVHGLTRDHSR